MCRVNIYIAIPSLQPKFAMTKAKIYPKTLFFNYHLKQIELMHDCLMNEGVADKCYPNRKSKQSYNALFSSKAILNIYDETKSELLA